MIKKVVIVVVILLVIGLVYWYFSNSNKPYEVKTGKALADSLGWQEGTYVVSPPSRPGAIQRIVTGTNPNASLSRPGATKRT